MKMHTNLPGLRDLFGAQACHGECLAVDQYSFTMFKDGKSWEILDSDSVANPVESR